MTEVSYHDFWQAWIVFFSLGAAFLTTSKDREARKFGFMLGLLSQPGWFYATWTADQWGNLLMAFVYTFMWCRGIYNNWRQG